MGLLDPITTISDRLVSLRARCMKRAMQRMARIVVYMLGAVGVLSFFGVAYCDPSVLFGGIGNPEPGVLTIAEATSSVQTTGFSLCLAWPLCLPTDDVVWQISGRTEGHLSGTAFTQNCVDNYHRIIGFDDLFWYLRENVVAAYFTQVTHENTGQDQTELLLSSALPPNISKLCYALPLFPIEDLVQVRGKEDITFWQNPRYRTEGSVHGIAGKTIGSGSTSVEFTPVP